MPLGITNEVISPDPDAPELPPPLEPNSQDTSDTPPVYQDINELSCKPNEVVTCDKSNQQYSQDNDSETVVLTDPHHEKVWFFTKLNNEVLNVYQLNCVYECVAIRMLVNVCMHDLDSSVSVFMHAACYVIVGICSNIINL